MSSVCTVVGSLREAAVFWMDHWRRRLRAGSFIVGGCVCVMCMECVLLRFSVVVSGACDGVVGIAICAI